MTAEAVAWALVCAFFRHYSRRCCCATLGDCFVERERLLTEIAPHLPVEARA